MVTEFPNVYFCEKEPEYIIYYEIKGHKRNPAALLRDCFICRLNLSYSCQLRWLLIKAVSIGYQEVER